jgi:hypothetical protein
MQRLLSFRTTRTEATLTNLGCFPGCSCSPPRTDRNDSSSLIHTQSLPCCWNRSQRCEVRRFLLETAIPECRRATLDESIQDGRPEDMTASVSSKMKTQSRGRSQEKTRARDPRGSALRSRPVARDPRLSTLSNDRSCQSEPCCQRPANPRTIVDVVDVVSMRETVMSMVRLSFQATPAWLYLLTSSGRKILFKQKQGGWRNGDFRAVEALRRRTGTGNLIRLRVNCFFEVEEDRRTVLNTRAGLMIKN